MKPQQMQSAFSCPCTATTQSEVLLPVSWKGVTLESGAVTAFEATDVPRGHWKPSEWLPQAALKWGAAFRNSYSKGGDNPNTSRWTIMGTPQDVWNRFLSDVFLAFHLECSPGRDLLSHRIQFPIITTNKVRKAMNLARALWQETASATGVASRGQSISRQPATAKPTENRYRKVTISQALARNQSLQAWSPG